MRVLLIQLPIPKINFGLNTANIALGAACLKQAAWDIPDCRVEILPEQILSHAGDKAVLNHMLASQPDIVGFTVFAWNRERSTWMAKKIKEQTRARIIFGGPEITPDSLNGLPDFIDFYVCGEGETIFKNLLSSENLWQKKWAANDPDACGLSFGNPYVNGHIKPGHDGVMLLETQRGCPYQCGFCYYSKSRKTIGKASDQTVLDAFSWAMDNKVKEIYLMDPSLNTRPGLKKLLEKIAEMNRSGRIALTSEIRAESVTSKMAKLFNKAGFKSFEVGLQSTNPEALKQMRRPTNLARFLSGAKALQDVGIAATIDLIFGLPGDTPNGFERTVDFVLSNRLDAHVQVFPLLVLPGTQFRQESKTLGLFYENKPPYPVIRTPGFSEHDLETALDLAEERFDRNFFPFPDLDLSYRTKAPGHIYIELDRTPYLNKLVVNKPEKTGDIKSLSERITSPFQIFIGRQIKNLNDITKILEILSDDNPFVPMEIVFFQPETIPETTPLLSAMSMPRPHFLDLDQRWLYSEPGNRSVVFTLVSERTDLFFKGMMQRQIFEWTKNRLPDKNTLKKLDHLDGILIDAPLPENLINQWQKEMAGCHEDYLPISFADIELQTRWIEITRGREYHIPLLKTRRG